MESKELFAHRLKELRTEKDMSLNELAEALQTTSQSLSLYERAERTASIELLAKAAKYFNVSTDYLMGLSNNKNEHNNDNMTLKEASEITERLTGLNQNTISSLCNYNLRSRECIEIINVFFEQKELSIDFLIGLSELASYSYVALKCTEDSTTRFYYGSKADVERYKLHQTLEKLLNVYDFGKLYSVSLAPYAEELLNEVQEELKNNGKHNPNKE